MAADWWSGNTPDICPESGGSKPSSAVFSGTAQPQLALQLRPHAHLHFAHRTHKGSGGRRTQGAAELNDSVDHYVNDERHHRVDALVVFGTPVVVVQVEVYVLLIIVDLFLDFLNLLEIVLDLV